MRMIIAGGGTGGHVTPAIATIAALRERPTAAPLTLLWVGSAGSVEERIANEQRIPFRAIQTGKLRRYLSVANLLDLGRIPVGVLQATAVVRQFRPDVVCSTGGFVSVPTVAAAGLQRVPVLTHEQTAQFGLASRLNLRFVRTVALSYEASRAFMPPTTQRVVVTGNPIRAEILQGDPVTGARLLGLQPDIPTIYVTGGALGARRLNLLMGQLVPELVSFCQIIHSHGMQEEAPTLADLEAVRASLPADRQRRYVIREFFSNELPHIYALAAAVVGRAGAGTVAELAALGKPAILIPLPGTGGDEQTKNAQLLAAAGGALLLPEDSLTSTQLLSAIRQLLDPNQAAQLAQMGVAARTQAPPDAAGMLADEILRLCQINPA